MNFANTESNHFSLHGTLVDRQSLRYTPVGIPVCEARIEHHSQQCENHLPREVVFEMPILAIGQSAQSLNNAPLGSHLALHGFMATRSQRSRTLVMHINTIEFLQGNQHG